MIHSDCDTCVCPRLSEDGETAIMIYLSLVLLSTFIISTIIYFSQLTANLWGTKKQIMEKQSASKPIPLPDKWTFLRRIKNIQDKDETKEETKEEERPDSVIETNNAEKEEKLEVTIISNKKPVVEKIEPQSEVKSVKSSALRKIFSCFLVKNKIPVNLPRTEWLGSTDCTVKKTVKLSALRKVYKQAGQIKLVRFVAEK